MNIIKNGEYNNVKLSHMGVGNIETFEKIYEEGKPIVKDFGEGNKTSYLTGLKYKGQNVSTFFSEKQYEEYQKLPLGFFTIEKIQDGKWVNYIFKECKNAGNKVVVEDVVLDNKQLKALEIYKKNRNRKQLIEVDGVKVTMEEFLPQDVLNNPEVYK